MEVYLAANVAAKVSRDMRKTCIKGGTVLYINGNDETYYAKVNMFNFNFINKII